MKIKENNLWFNQNGLNKFRVDYFNRSPSPSGGDVLSSFTYILDQIDQFIQTAGDISAEMNLITVLLLFDESFKISKCLRFNKCTEMLSPIRPYRLRRDWSILFNVRCKAV